MKKRKALEVILYILLPLVIGATLYYIFCPETIFVEWIDKNFNLDYHVSLNYENALLMLLRYYLFDALWSYALMMAVLYIMQPPKEKIMRTFLLVLLFEIIMEAMQLFDSVKGTFDVCDILLEAIVNVLVIKIYTWRKYHEKEI